MRFKDLPDDDETQHNDLHTTNLQWIALLTHTTENAE